MADSDDETNAHQPPGTTEPTGRGLLQPPVLFGVVVRALGLYYVAEAIATGASGWHPAEGYSPIDYAASAIVYLAIGVVLFLGADLVVALAYRDRP